MISVIVIYYITFTSVGISSMVVDRSLRQAPFATPTHPPCSGFTPSVPAGQLWEDHPLVEVHHAQHRIRGGHPPHVWLFPWWGRGRTCQVIHDRILNAHVGVIPSEHACGRALMIAILHFGLGVWGLLLWSHPPSDARHCHLNYPPSRPPSRPPARRCLTASALSGRTCRNAMLRSGSITSTSTSSM